MVEVIVGLRRRWRTAVVIFLLSLGISAAITQQMTPTYDAQTQMFIALGDTDSNAIALQSGVLFANSRVKSYPDLVKSPLVLDPVIKSLGLDTTAQALSSKISAEVTPNTVLMNINVTDGSPTQAADIANSVAKNLVPLIESLDSSQGTSQTAPVRATIVRPAVAPSSASSPIPWLNLTIGGFLGLVLGLGAAALREALDTTVKNDGDVEQATGMPTIGMIPVNADSATAPTINHGQGNTVWAESYRMLRTNISYLDPDNPPKSIIVTSALSGDGKSLTSINLAASMGQNNRRAILIEADLRRPSISSTLGLTPDVGVTTVVAGKALISDVLQHATGFDVITSGPIPPNPSELLGSHAFGRMIEELGRTYDSIIIDSPPLLAVTDAAVASLHADGVVVVCSARRTKRQELKRAIESLLAVEAKVLGVVVNRIKGQQGGYYEYSYRYEYRSVPANGRRKR